MLQTSPTAAASAHRTRWSGSAAGQCCYRRRVNVCGNCAQSCRCSKENASCTGIQSTGQRWRQSVDRGHSQTDQSKRKSQSRAGEGAFGGQQRGRVSCCSASSQPQLRTTLSISQRHMPPDVSLLHTYASVVASQLATTFVVPPPRSRYNARNGVSVGTQSSANAEFPSRSKPLQIASLSAVPTPVSAALPPPPFAKRLPDAAQHAGGGSVRSPGVVASYASTDTI